MQKRKTDNGGCKMNVVKSQCSSNIQSNGLNNVFFDLNSKSKVYVLSLCSMGETHSTKFHISILENTRSKNEKGGLK